MLRYFSQTLLTGSGGTWGRNTSQTISEARTNVFFASSFANLGLREQPLAQLQRGKFDQPSHSYPDQETSPHIDIKRGPWRQVDAKRAFSDGRDPERYWRMPQIYRIRISPEKAHTTSDEAQDRPNPRW